MGAPSRRPRLTLALPLAAAALLALPGAVSATPNRVILGVEGAEAPGRVLLPGVGAVTGGAQRARRLEASDGVRWAEPNRTFRASGMPNDRLFARQWALANPTGIGAAAAWWSSRGDGAVVAVLDSGIDLDHPDLRDNIWTNAGEVPANGLDDDRNGYVDDVHGADTVQRDGAPQDGLGHGTRMAGIAAARGDNGIGVRGVAPHAKIMPVRVLDDAGAGSTETIVAGIAYALRQGARVINLSLNGPEHSQALDEAIRAAERNGVVVVVSAGNAGQNIDRTPSYPASSSSPNVIAVAAGSRDGGLTAFSGWGRAGVDLAAPGEGVLSTSLGGGYSTGSGTSEAAAHVSGAIALLASAMPSANAGQLRGALLAGTRKLHHDGFRVATGALDVARALRQLKPGSGPAVRIRARRITRSRSPVIKLRWRASGATAAVAGYRVKVAGRDLVMRARSGRAAGTRRRLRLRPGRHRWQVTALDAGGRPLASRRSWIRIAKRPR